MDLIVKICLAHSREIWKSLETNTEVDSVKELPGTSGEKLWLSFYVFLICPSFVGINMRLTLFCIWYDGANLFSFLRLYSAFSRHLIFKCIILSVINARSWQPRGRGSRRWGSLLKKRQEFAFIVERKIYNIIDHCIFVMILTQIIGDWSMLKPCGHSTWTINIEIQGRQEWPE